MYIFKIQNCIFALIVHWERNKVRQSDEDTKGGIPSNIVKILYQNSQDIWDNIQPRWRKTKSKQHQTAFMARVGHFLLVSSKTSFTWAQISVQETSRLLVFKHWRKYSYWAGKAYENAKFPTLQRCALLGVCVFQVFHHVTSCFSDITVWARCILGGECSSWGLFTLDVQVTDNTEVEHSRVGL